jgi:putative glutamine amidotransferase
MRERPVVVIPGRFAASTSALRYSAVVTARALSAAVLTAGGEPLTMHPWAPGGRVEDAEVAQRLRVADAVLLPGGGDLSPRHYGGAEHPSLYDVDDEQDAFDLAVARVCLAEGIPLLAVCRGLQVVTAARGGDLVADMGDGCHHHLVQDVRVAEGSALAAALGATAATVSCYHHQCVARPGAGLVPAASTEDGTPEAYEIPGHPGWFLGVQWHPEDTPATDPAQAALFAALVAAGRERAAQRAGLDAAGAPSG